MTSRIPRLISEVIAIGFLSLLAYIVATRIGYPFELEWMEGGMMDNILRVLQGKPLYGPPGMTFVPYLYPPLYYWLSAGAVKLFGLGFAAPRMISALSTLAMLILLFRWTWRETGNTRFGLLAAGFFAATYPLSGTWMDLVRVDALAWALFFGGAYLARFAQGRRGMIAGGLLLGLAVLTKQTALLALLAVLVGTWLRSGRRTLPLVVTASLTVILPVIWLNATSDGWYLFYTWQLPKAHPIMWGMLWRFWLQDILPTVPIAFLAVATLVWRSVSWKSGSRTLTMDLFLPLLWLGLLGVAWTGRLNSGGWENVILPLHFGLGLGFALFLSQWDKSWATQGLRRSLLWTAVLIQFALMIYSPTPFIPSREDRQAGEAFLREVASVPGPVWIPYHAWAANRMGEPMQVHAMAAMDLIRSKSLSYRGEDPQAALAESMLIALRTHRYPTVITDHDTYPAYLDQYYRRDHALFADSTVFWPRSGGRTRPEWVWVPK